MELLFLKQWNFKILVSGFWESEQFWERFILFQDQEGLCYKIIELHLILEWNKLVCVELFVTTFVGGTYSEATLLTFLFCF